MNLATKLKVAYPWLVALVAAVLLGGTERWTAAATAAGTSSVFAAMITFAGLIITVLIGFLGILANINEREIITTIRKGGMYPQLVSFVYRPLLGFVIVAVLAVVALIVSEVGPSIVSKALTIGMLSIALGSLLATIRFVRFLVEILVFEGHGARPKRADATPEAARRRAAAAAEESDKTGDGYEQRAFELPAGA